MDIAYTLAGGELSRYATVRQAPWRLALIWIALKQNEADDTKQEMERSRAR